MNKQMRKRSRLISWLLSVVITAMAFMPYLPVQAAKLHNPGDSLPAFGNNWHFYCIDAYGVASNGILQAGDMYTYVLPSTRLNDTERAYLFWATLSMLAGFGNQQNINTVIDKINAGAAGAGLTPINKMVTQTDLKTIIHKAETRAKYPWLVDAVNNAEEYMKLGGIISSGTETSNSGKSIPTALKGHTDLSTALSVGNTFTIEFDVGGADKDFIQKVPLKFSLDGGDGSFLPKPMGGWTYQKTDTNIIFSNPNPTPPQLYIQFDTYGTEYQTAGSFASVEDAYEDGLQLWVCTQCSGTHVSHSKKVPLEDHQRLVFLELETSSKPYYAAIGTDPVPSLVDGSIDFKIYRHNEEMKSTYNLQLNKYDDETGKPLSNAIFKLYERFDDKGRVNRERDGAVELYEGGEPYKSYYKDNPVIWDNFRFVGSVTTDESGYGEKTVNHTYNYDKTFCDGHPAPEFVSVPEEEIDEETGEVTNEDEIEDAQAENQRLANAWVSAVSDCEEYASGEFEGVHFHWIQPGVNVSEIESVLSDGGSGTPDGGVTTSASEEEAYQESGCKADCQATYEKLISMKYSYTWIESTAKDGYTLHDLHPDDIPIEVITTDASENGANATFSGMYSKDIAIAEVTGSSASMVKAQRAAIEAFQMEEPVEEDIKLEQEKEPTIIQKIINFFLPYDPELEDIEIEDELNEDDPFFDDSDKTATNSNAYDNSQLLKLSSFNVSNSILYNENEEAMEKPETEAVEEVETDAAEKIETKTAEEIETEAVEESEKEVVEKTETEAAEEPETESAEVTEPVATKEPETELEKKIKTEVKQRISKVDKATNSNALVPSEILFTTISNARLGISLLDEEGDNATGGGALFVPAYNTALISASVGDDVEAGPSTNYSHCNDLDREGNRWRIYDHRTEGEIHVKKYDMELLSGESSEYDASGDAQGDGTVEGGVYGLFAASALTHPDGKTGTVYEANDLVSIGTADKNGELSFMAYTEAPGFTYNYETGTVVKTASGWAGKAPTNLYVADSSYDDYSADGQYKRLYYDNKSNNGNGWIGRPLLMGDYYVKELSRSEGFELSVGSKENSHTNNGQEVNAGVPGNSGSGYAAITKNLYPEGQISDNPTGEWGSPDYNELFFAAESKGTGVNGFDILLNNLPEGSKIYRLDNGNESRAVDVGTGVYDKVMLGYYVTAENDYQYPKYNPDGSLMTTKVSTNYQANQFQVAQWQDLDTTAVQAALESEEPAMTDVEVLDKLASDFSADDFNFLKGKAEKALRSSGKKTPKIKFNGTGYSSIYAGIFDAGVREGDIDAYGVSGVAPGSPASRTVYGSPIVTLQINKLDSQDNPIKVGDAILSVLDFYNTNSFYNYGGVHSIEEDSDTYYITVYASQYGNPKTFFAAGSDQEIDSIIYNRVEYLPDDTDESPRYIYATYSNNPNNGAFGTYDDFKSELIGSRYYISARLITDAVATETGGLISKTITQNVYYQTGETPYDKDGNPIEAFEYVEQTTTNMQDVTVGQWKELPLSTVNGATICHIDSNYTDSYGAAHADDNLQSYNFRIVVPEKQITLTQAHIDAMGNPAGWFAGDKMGSASYYVAVRKASLKIYLDYEELSIAGEGSYIKAVTLSYPGQEYIWQDGENRPGTNTRLSPVRVEQRAIKQQIKVTKKIDHGSYENTNSYSDVHEDWFTKLFGTPKVNKLDNFRFKTYLRSNLLRLYRDEVGSVTWVDQKGNEIDILTVNDAYPELVNKIYTKAPHQTDPLYRDSNDAVIYNKELYNYTNDLINDGQNSGYTAILETSDQLVEDATGTRVVKGYNYEKFFDAVAVANNDKWDLAAPTYTSYQPIGNKANRTTYTIENAKASDMVRQFAITWYLDDEIAKKVQNVPSNNQEAEAAGNVTYSDELYDEALYQAIVKAENYLKPFFSYDIDEIYAVDWDTENSGGADNDLSTLSANIEGDEYYFNTSEYLPYGVYVVSEQQPQYSSLNDFANRHYQIDKPREVVVPTAYASYDGSQQTPAVLNDYYNYDAEETAEELAAKYQIRFIEENHVIKAHNYNGDFEVYKHGLSISQITNGIPSTPGVGYFALTQSEYRPLKNYYNIQDDRKAGDVPYYLTEGQSGRNGISTSYRYSSVSESFGVANDVPYPGAAVTEDNLVGIKYQDNVKSMQGNLTAYDGKFAAMLVPYTITAPASASSEANEVMPQPSGESSYIGYAYNQFENRFYTSKLRIEKLDSETHENILHDGAIFGIYAAKRDDSKDGDGAVLFYKTDTLVTGTKEFLEAMGASGITPFVQKLTWFDKLIGKEVDPGNLYSGTIPAGSPICEESDQVILGDSFGNQTVAFKAYSTVLDGLMKDETDNSTLRYQYQTVGYIETPQPLGAGTYVVAELKPTSGYTRSKPVALEVYSDKVAYYKEGNKDDRVLAAMYEDSSDNQTTNGDKPQDVVNVARINVENAPIKLTVEKVKESSLNTAETTADKTVTYKVSGRVDGTLAEIGNNPDLVYAYSENGTYLGYGWKKGTLEQLAARKASGEAVELAYDGNVFSGYGFVTRTLETANDTNQYIAGATMTLFDALELKPTGDTQDHAYQGLTIERNRTNNITRMYLKEGFAGEKVEFVKEKDVAGNEYQVNIKAGVDKNQNPIMKSGAIWTAETVQRSDTDILYYDLDSLNLFTTKKIDGHSVTYGYNRNQVPVPLSTLESDKANFDKTDSEYSIYAFKNGAAYLEFVGGDFTKIRYSAKDKVLEVGKDTRVYHIDRDGNRDALVDPYTGMAYVLEAQPDGSQKVLVWAVNIRKDAYGNIIGRDKITTSRIATVGENKTGYSDSGTIEVTNNSGTAVINPSYSHSESGYITGSWNSDGGEESHKQSSVLQNSNGQSMNDSTLVDRNNGSFEKDMNPVYDKHGLPSYYQRSNETYDKGTELYDRNGDFVRFQDSDNLKEYNQAAYHINESEELLDGDETAENQDQKDLYHRLGEAYIVQNTWVTSDTSPNDPFDFNMTDGQADILKRLPEGNYILEELISPEGMNKGFPVGKTVEETADMQNTKMVDVSTKTEIEKLDGTNTYTVNRIDMRSGKTMGTVLEGKGTYSYGHVSGADLALYKAKRVYTASGYYLQKAADTPLAYASTNNTISAPEVMHAAWTTGTTPVYLEGLPIGDYLLEETKTPTGYTTATPVEITITNTREVQNFTMNNDHTKVEVEKYVTVGNERVFLGNVGFTLYPAIMDKSGVVYKNGNPVYDDTTVIDTWMTNDATDYTETIDLRNYPNSNQYGQSGFTLEFESMYKINGTKPGTKISWAVERTATRASEKDTVWVMEDGTKIPIINGVITYPAGMDQQDMDGFLSAYDSNHRANTIKWIVNRSASYVSHTQIDSGNTSVFPTEATMFFEADNGEMIRITVYEGTADRNGRNYTFEYQYDYKQLSAVNSKAYSYLTAEGYRRFNYLPTGMTYVLVETSVPEGYAKAEDTVITVKDIADVQHYAIENEVSAIRISKVSGDGTKEFAGNELALYKAASDGSLIKTPEYLLTTWLTGSDGEYTEADFINGRIPEGYSQGDLKPHTITGMDNGIYYVVENASADYYTLFKPIRIEYNRADDIRIVRASNQVAEGQLEINKADETGTNLLTGAVFDVSAFLQQSESREPVFTRTVSTINGKATLTGLPVGRVLSDGSVEPYRYRVKETVPPDGYAVNTLIKTFSFASDNGGESYQPGETAKYSITVLNEKTKITIEKRDFDKLEDTGIDGAFVKGAQLAIFELLGRDAKDNFIYDETKAFTEWTTTAEQHMVEGMVAGKSYLLVEKKAPKGYNLMKPVMFTVSQDGRKITTISDKLHTITVNTIQTDDFAMDTYNPDVDSIQSVTISGRYPTKMEKIMVNEAGNEILRWTTTGNGYDIYPSENLVEGGLYTIREIVCFSDGSELLTGKTTRRLHFNDGRYHVEDRTIGSNNLTLAHANGTEIHSYKPQEYLTEEIIQNHVNPENPKIFLWNRDGQPGDVLNPNQAVLGSVFYTNTSHTATDVKLTLRFDDAVRIIDSGAGDQDDNKLTFTIPDVKPLQGGYVTFELEADHDFSSTSVIATLTSSGKTTVTTKETPILQANKLTIFNELTGSGKYLFADQTSQFMVRLYSDNGVELKGSYEYTGSKYGIIKSGDTISLAGNEFIIINPGSIYKNIRYDVTRIKDGLEVVARNTSGTASSELGAAAIFTRHIVDTSEREIFIKGEEYLLTETTVFSDGEILKTNQLKFMISEDGSIEGMGVYDKQTKQVIHKTDITTGEELPGTHIVIEDEVGNIIDEWISSDKPHKIGAELEPGKEYTMIEKKPTEGFAHEKNIKFSVNEDGAYDVVIMEDKPNTEHIYKLATASEAAPDFKHPGNQAGAVMQILDADKQPVKAIRDDNLFNVGEDLIFTTTNEFTVITKQLVVDKTYYLHEITPPAGLAYADDVSFTVSHDGTIDTVIMWDIPTHVVISKTDITGEKELPGGHYSIHEDDGGEKGKKVYEYDGNVDGSPQEVTGILKAGRGYWLVEDCSPIGYAYSEAVKFKVSTDGSPDYVAMKDKETHINIRKENATGKLLGKAILQIVDAKGAVVLEFETVEDKIYSLVGKLIAGERYILREKHAPSGYSIAGDIAFTVSSDGSIDTITMVDQKITGGGSVTPPIKPTIEEHRKKVGRIEAEYGSEVFGEGRIPFGFTRLPRTGVDSNINLFAILVVLFSLGLVVSSIFDILKARRKENEE